MSDQTTAKAGEGASDEGASGASIENPQEVHAENRCMVHCGEGNTNVIKNDVTGVTYSVCKSCEMRC